MMIDRLAGNAALKDSVRLMLGSRRLTHSVLLVGETGLGAGYAARCVAADYLYPAGGAPAWPPSAGWPPGRRRPGRPPRSCGS